MGKHEINSIDMQLWLKDQVLNYASTSVKGRGTLVERLRLNIRLSGEYAVEKGYQTIYLGPSAQAAVDAYNEEQ